MDEAHGGDLQPHAGPFLLNRAAVVTGGAHGLGRGVALALGTVGADESLFDRGEDGMQKVARLLKDRGARSLSICGDVRDNSALQECVNLSVDRFPGVAPQPPAPADGEPVSVQFERRYLLAVLDEKASAVDSSRASLVNALRSHTVAEAIDRDPDVLARGFVENATIGTWGTG